MLRNFINLHRIIVLILLIFIGALFRLYKINWDQYHFLHPDERFIGGAVWWFYYGTNLHPPFFSYGSFPLYVNFAISKLAGFFIKFTENDVWANSMYLGRYISALLSILIIPLGYKTVQIFIKNKQSVVPLLCAFFISTSVGLVQYAHFATYEIILAFEYLFIFFLSLKLISKTTFSNKTISNTLFLAVLFGLSLSTKITSFIILPLPLLAVIFSKSSNGSARKRIIIEKTSQIFFFLLIALLTFFITSPYNFLDFPSFRFSMDYESRVATGMPVFFTSQFIKTIPLVYQFTKIFPWIMNPLLTLFFIPAFGWMIYKIAKNRHNYPYILLLVTIAVILSQSFLFIKWTRYMIPLLPFFYILVSLFIKSLEKFVSKYLFYGLLSIILIFSSVWCFSFFSIYQKTDTRIAAAEWLLNNIPHNAQIFTEDMDSGYAPIKAAFPQLVQFDFYQLDNSQGVEKEKTLKELLNQSDYFIILSRQVYATRLSHKDKFPRAARFYQQLFNNTLGYKKIYESKNPFIFLGFPIIDDSAEQTFQVFDHAKVMIFKKMKNVNLNL